MRQGNLKAMLAAAYKLRYTCCLLCASSTYIHT